MKQIYEKKPDCACPKCRTGNREQKPRFERLKILRALDRLEVHIERLLKGENYEGM